MHRAGDTVACIRLHSPASRRTTFTLQRAVDGGDGSATVALDATQTDALDAMSLRLLSNPELDRVTGADLGAGPGAGSTTGDIQR